LFHYDLCVNAIRESGRVIITQSVHAVHYADLKMAGHFAERDFIVPKDALPKEW
jgi:hypothetical protein